MIILSGSEGSDSILDNTFNQHYLVSVKRGKLNRLIVLNEAEGDVVAIHCPACKQYFSFPIQRRENSPNDLSTATQTDTVI